ncbi:hypothetical protein ACIPUP_09705 [Pectobacterium actinidiae]|uniref:Secreted protein n=1 Tax=Pectobacterium actinidiae TaxID=1507808 RepID=A0ABW8G9R5_9GAMM
MLLPPPERPPTLPVALAGWASTTQVWPVRCLEGRGNVGCCRETFCTENEHISGMGKGQGCRVIVRDFRKKGTARLAPCYAFLIDDD